MKETYWQKLKRHPGVPMAAAMTFLGAIAGASNPTKGALLGAIIMGGWMWPIVLWTARDLPDETDERGP